MFYKIYVPNFIILYYLKPGSAKTITSIANELKNHQHKFTMSTVQLWIYVSNISIVLSVDTLA